MGHVREGIHFQRRVVVINFMALESAPFAPGENTLEVVFKMHIDFYFENGGNLIRNVPTFWRGWGRSSRGWTCHGDWACRSWFILWSVLYGVVETIPGSVVRNREMLLNVNEGSICYRVVVVIQ